MSGIGIDSTYGGWVSAGGTAPTLTATAQSGPWRATSKTFAGTNLTGCTALAFYNGASLVGTVTPSSSTSTTVTATLPAFTQNYSNLNVVATTASGNSGTSGNGIYTVAGDPIDLGSKLRVFVDSDHATTSTLTDRSGNSNNGTVAVPASVSVVASVLNGRPAFRMAGTEVDFGNLSAQFPSAGYIFEVFTFASPSGNGSIYETGLGTGGGGNDSYLDFVGTVILPATFAGGRYSFSPSSFSYTSSPTCAEIRSISTDYQVWINDVMVAEDATASLGYAAGTSHTIGVYSSGKSPTNCDVFAVVVCNAIPNASEITMLRAWRLRTYGF